MKRIVSIYLIFILSITVYSSKTVHVFVSLCDNKYQNIVPVSKKLGDGKDLRNNLYWGAAYGVKSYFKRDKNWKLIKKIKTKNGFILERILFKHKKKDLFMLADAYDGERIKNCTIDFLKAVNKQNVEIIEYKNKKLKFGGGADLVSYIGHDGLMDFDLNIKFEKIKKGNDTIILACYSKNFFKKHIKKGKGDPILWTTHLMAPEAYTLNVAIESWSKGESGKKIKEKAAQIYNKYQKCGIRGARNLFTTGF